ncbi:MAG: hypothetical protein AB1Z98_09640 [Nannocystaceae bacterium]
MRVRSARISWSSPLLAALVLLGCDPPSAGRSKDDTLLRGADDEGTRDPAARAALGKAEVVVLEDGTVQIFDRHGELRAQIIDPRARFVDTLEPMAGTKGWARPNPELSIPLAGLSEWLTKRGQDRKAKATLEAKGLTESQRQMVAIAEAAERTENSLAALDDELAALWADTGRPAAERRRLLFARWDECEEGDPAAEPLTVVDAAAAADAIRARAGARARATIEAFVRAELPAGGTAAYPAEELARLNEGRTSAREFAPYDTPAPAPTR